MTIDNRTNHFTDEQVIAAAMVIDRNAFRVGEAESNAWETGRDFPSELSAAKQRIRTRKYRAKKNARAALVAAAGVAPVQPLSTVDEAALIREAKAEALNEAAEHVAEQSIRYADTASRLHDEGEWVDSSRYSNYAAGVSMALITMRARAAEYRQGSET